jgi:Domain of unknown function (DUF4349)
MSTVDLLRAHAPSAPDHLHQRVLMLRPVERKHRVRPVLVLAVAAAIAVLAAVVHGFSTSSPPQGQTLTLQTDSGSVRAPAPATGTPADSASGGSGALSGTVEQKAFVPAVPSPAPGRLQHTDASITVRVDDLGATTTRATRIATSLGGYAQSVVYRTPQGSGGQSYIELRIPAQHVKQALSRLAALGVLVSQQISIDDLTNTLERQSVQIAQLHRRIAALQAALRNPALPDAQRVLLQIQLAEAKRALGQRVHGRKGTIAAGVTSRVSLVLTTKKHTAAAPPHRGRLGRMLHSAVGFLAIEAMVALFALIVISPVAVALALLWFWRRRATDRLLME